MTAIAAPHTPAGSRSERDWDEIALRAPKLAATMGRYLTQAATFLAPLSVESADNALRLLARWLLDRTDVRTVAEISRDDIEDFKVALAQRRGIKGQALTANTQRQRLRMLRMFFERIIEWDWPDAPIRNPIIGGDIPPRPEPLPKFLDDRDAAKLMAAARAANDPRDRLVVEVLARTGLRASELCDLDADAVVRIGDGHWLRYGVQPKGADNLDHIRAHHRLIADHRGPIDRHQVGRIVRRVARRAGVTAHPTSSATPSPPKPSTEACPSKPSPLCSVTAPWT